MCSKIDLFMWTVRKSCCCPLYSTAYWSQQWWRLSSLMEWHCHAYSYHQQAPPERKSCLVYSLNSLLCQYPSHKWDRIMSTLNWFMQTNTLAHMTIICMLLSCNSSITKHTSSLPMSMQRAIAEKSRYPAIAVSIPSISARNWENFGLWSGSLSQHCCITIL